MVLGYDAKGVYTPCDSWPIVSTWGDGGIGAAALYVAAERIEKDVAHLPGGATLALSSGWDVYETNGQSEARYRAEGARIVADAEVGAFVKDVRACLAGTDSEACLRGFFATTASPGTDSLVVARSCFARPLRGETKEWGTVHLYGDEGSCELEKTPDGWRIQRADRGC
jgi:hypothetical protein